MPVSQELQRAQNIASQTKVMTSAGTRSSSNTPDYQNRAYTEQHADWVLLADVCGGTKVVRRRKTKYLPKAPAETEGEYKARLDRTEFYNATQRTITGLAGMVFRRPVTLAEDMPAPLVEHWENIDGEGNHGDVFASFVFEDALRDGHAAILVDFPEVPNAGQQTLADERASGARPYWVGIRADQILSYRTRVIAGKQTLTQIVIKECVTEEDGLFGEVEVTQFRVFLRLDDGTVAWQLWRYTGRHLSIHKEGVVTNQTEIPVAPVYADRPCDYFHTKPPLLDLAYTNIAHYQVSSDHRHSLHVASVPILVFKGRDTTQGEQVIGPNIGIDVSESGDVKYVEHSGAALNQTRQEMQDLELRMATLGLSMLQRETRAAETAEAKRIDKSEQDSRLSRAARFLEDALERAFGFHANYLKLQGGSAKVNREFEAVLMDPAQVTMYSQMVIAGQLSLETMWTMLAEGNVLPADFDPEEEKSRIMETLMPPMVTEPNPDQPGQQEPPPAEDEEPDNDQQPPAAS